MSAHDLYLDLSDIRARIYELEFQLANIDANNSKNTDLIQDLKKQLQKSKDTKVVIESAIEALNGRS